MYYIDTTVIHDLWLGQRLVGRGSWILVLGAVMCMDPVWQVKYPPLLQAVGTEAPFVEVSVKNAGALGKSNATFETL